MKRLPLAVAFPEAEPMTSWTWRIDFAAAESVTSKVSVVLAVAVGVPESQPVGENTMPVGSVPAVIAH